LRDDATIPMCKSRPNGRERNKKAAKRRFAAALKGVPSVFGFTVGGTPQTLYLVLQRQLLALEFVNPDRVRRRMLLLGHDGLLHRVMTTHEFDEVRIHRHSLGSLSVAGRHECDTSKTTRKARRVFVM
jgi:hypothetical protein